MKQNKNVVIIATLSILMTNIFYGFNANIQKFLLPEYLSPVSLATIRTVSAAAILWIISIFVKSEKIDRKDRFNFLMNGLMGGFGIPMFYLLGLSLTSPIDSSIILVSTPIWTFILARFYFNEHITRRKLLGLILGLLASLIIILNQNSSANATSPILGDILCLVATIATALSYIYTKKLTSKYSTTMITKMEYTVGAILSIIVAIFAGFDFGVIKELGNNKITYFIGYVVIFATVLSVFLNNVAQKSLPVTVTSLYKYIMLIIASIVSIIAKQDTLSWYQPVSAIMILGSVIIVTSTKKTIVL